MSSFGAWSVKGIDDRARAAAKEQARLKGVTLGDYINTLLLQEHDQPDRAPGISPARPLNGTNPASPASEPSAHRQDPVSPIDSLARRIEAAEARSTLAITGIDQSVLGLLTRIETSENNASAIAGEVEGMIDELRQTHEALQNKVRALEHDDTAQKNLQTVKSLEQALAQLANHVHDENMLAQEDSEAIKARIEAGFCEFTDRVDTIEHQIESRLSDAAERVYKVVEKAELRAEGTSKHLSERFTDVEASVARRLAKIDTLASRLSKVEEDVGGVNTLLAQEAHYGARMSQIEDEVLNAVEALEKGLDASQQADIVIAERVGVIEGDVSGAISSMEETLLRIQDRLNRAETTTDSALKALEETFANLDKRIESIALNSDPAIADTLRDKFEQKFEDLASELRTTVENTRLQLAKEIENAAQRINPGSVHRLEDQVEQMQTQIVDGQDRSTEAIQAIGEQVNHLAMGLNERIEHLEDRDDGDLIQQVSEKLDDFSTSFENRIADSEQRSATAIEQVGHQVANAIQRVKARQESQQQDLLKAVSQSKQVQDTQLSKALSNISDRLTKIQESTAASVSPVQKAIVSLATRLEAVEDFTTPPHADRPKPKLPVMPGIKPDRARLEKAFEPEEVDFSASSQDKPDDGSVMFESQTDFYADAPDYQAGRGTDRDADPAMDFDPRKALSDFEETEDESDLNINEFLVQDTDHESLQSEFDDWTEESFDTENYDHGSEDDLVDSTDMDFESLSGESDSNPSDNWTERNDKVMSQHNTTDYLNRARQAALAAAEDTKPKHGNMMRGMTDAAGRFDISLNLRDQKSKKKSKSKLQVMAAVSVMTVSAGAAGYVHLRGKQAIDPLPAFTKAEFLETHAQSAIPASALLPDYAMTAPASEIVTEADTLSVPSDPADLDTELFEAEEADAPILANLQIMPESLISQTTPALARIAPMQSLKEAALAGNPVAEYQYADTRLAKQDYTAGVDFVTRAALAGLPVAQYRLAKLYERGLGVDQDMELARSWTEKAARGGNIKAMHDLAVFYAEGEGGEQSYAAAVDWFRQAAEFGLVDSQYNLGVMYQNGNGLSPDPIEALYWFEVAVLNGDTSALENVRQLRETLPSASLSSLPERLENWTPADQASAANGEFGPQPWQSYSSAQVRAIQHALTGFGFDAGMADGVLGPGTRQAVRNFQRVEGLDVTGRINKDLIDALNRRIDARG